MLYCSFRDVATLIYAFRVVTLLLLRAVGARAAMEQLRRFLGPFEESSVLASAGAGDPLMVGDVLAYIKNFNQI